jgi:hypothetical protein
MENIKINSEVGELIRKQEEDYVFGTPVTISKYVEQNMYEDICTIDAYDNSKHISGDKDSKGNDKPFFNVVTAVKNIWYRATDIDRKHIRIYTDKAANYVASFIATIYLQNWMDKVRFGTFLNKWGMMLAKYGSAVVKFVEKDGELKPIVCDWQKLIVDPIDFYANPVMEVLDLTPAQLRKRGYSKDVVESLVASKEARETLEGHDKDQRDGYVRIYEVHGEFPLSYLTDDEDDEDTYQQMMIVYSFSKNKDGDFEDYFLYRGKEEKNPYMLTHLLEEDGKTLSTGAIKQLFETQWMVNHSVKAIKDQLDLASKLIFQTSDENFAGKNAITSIATGDFLVHAPNQSLTQVANNSHDITSLQNFKSEWQAIGNEQTGASDAMRGIQPKSGTAWRQTEAILQENHSLFEIMTENKGLHIEDMLRQFVLPFLKKKLNNKDEIVAELDAHNLKKLDMMYIKAEARKQFESKVKDTIKEALLKGEIPEGFDISQENIEQDLQKDLLEFGTERFIVPSEVSSKTWKEIFKDLEWNVSVDVTGESKDLQAHLTTLNTLYVTMVNSGQLEDARKVLEKILEITGAFSPVELSAISITPPQSPVSPEAIPAEVPQETT